MSHRLPLADIKFISEFAAFCRTKGDEGYSFFHADSCALAQFVKSAGMGREQALPCGVYKHQVEQDAWGFTYDTPIFRAVCNFGNDWTFSALADRLEALIADAPAVRVA